MKFNGSLEKKEEKKKLKHLWKLSVKERLFVWKHIALQYNISTNIIPKYTKL